MQHISMLVVVRWPSWVVEQQQLLLFKMHTCRCASCDVQGEMQQFECMVC